MYLAALATWPDASSALFSFTLNPLEQNMIKLQNPLTVFAQAFPCSWWLRQEGTEIN